MKIVFLDKKTLGDDISLKAFDKFGEVIIYETTKSYETLKRVQEADIVVCNKVIISKEIMEKSNIKLICISATGTNNVDLEYAKKNKIPVKNVKDYSTSSVSQITFALALELICHTQYYSNYTKDGKWEKSDIFTHINQPFFELENKNWGIIGLGQIGKKVAKIANGFDCNVNYYSTSGTNYDTQYNYLSLEDLLRTSDIISIHAPLNEQTKNLINKNNLSLLKEKSIIINVGRGGIINEEDLAKALDEKEFYCALDVLEKEPMKANNVLKNIKHKNRLIITPHIAWASIEARKKLIDGIIKNIKEYVL